MKKLFTIVIMLTLITMVALSGMAADSGDIKEGNLNLSDTTTVKANVLPYAKIIWGDKDVAQFSGAANERLSGGQNFTLETNTSVGFILETEKFTQTINGETYELKDVDWSVYKPENGPNWGPLPGAGTHTYYENRKLQDIGANNWLLKYKASTGEISDQYAGEYSSTVTLTITGI